MAVEVSRSAAGRWAWGVTVWWALALPAVAQEYRTWSDATGRFQLRAKLLSREGGSVTLERDTGAKVTIEVAKLSAADQEYLSKADTDNPFKTVEESPFQPVPAAPAPAAAGPKVVTVDWSNSTALALDAANSQWQLPPPGPGPAFRAKTVAIPPKTDFFEKLSGVAINPFAKKAVVGYSLGKGNDAKTRIIFCDLEQGKTLATATGPGQMAPLALHDNGQYVLMRRDEFGFGNLDRLEIWSIRQGNIAKPLIWTPYDDARGADRDVMWAEFLDANTLATSSRGGRVALWQLSSATPICHFELVGGAVPCLSGDRKWIAFASKDRVGLFDVARREIAVLAETPGSLTWPYVAFSPSGQKIGCIAQDRILVWDAATGNLERDFATPGLHIHGAIDFPHDNFLLANNQFLIALDSQLKLWHYQHAEFVRTVGGTTFLAVSGRDKPGALLATQMPHPAATAMLDKALKQPDLFVFREGTTVKLDVSGVPSDQQNRVAKALTEKLRQMKCNVAPNGTIDLVAKVEGPKQKQVSFINSGDYQVQEYLTRLTFVYQGKPAWQTSGGNIPGFIMLKSGENIEGVLRRASQQPSYEFYDRVVLPKFLQKPSDSQSPGGGQTLGASNVTPEGFK